MDASKGKKNTGRIVQSRYLSSLSSGNSSKVEKIAPTKKEEKPVQLRKPVALKTSVVSKKNTIPAVSEPTFTKAAVPVKNIKNNADENLPPVNRTHTSHLETTTSPNDDIASLRSKFLQWLYFNRKSSKSFKEQAGKAQEQISQVQHGLFAIEKEAMDFEAFLGKLEIMKRIHKGLDEQETYLTEVVLAMDRVQGGLQTFHNGVHNSTWKMKSKSMYLESLPELDSSIGNIESLLREKLAGLQVPLIQSCIESLSSLRKTYDEETVLLSNCQRLYDKGLKLLNHESSLRIHLIQQLAQ